MEAWLDGLDVVLFVERPVFLNAPALARRLGILVVCVPNWEWLHPGIEWLQDVDLMVCPTQHTSDMLSNWKSRFDFKWDLTCVPWPVDTNRFQFRLRRVCKRFIFVNGSGGTVATVCGGSQSRMRRKGLDVALAAALQAPEISMIVYAFPEDVSYRPSNVELRPMPLDNRDLYKDGDVCVQPSHWEGLGLPLLECQAAGMPLITTNAPPMSEHHPLALIPAEIVASRLTQNLVIPAAHIQPDDLAAVLRSANGRRIGSQSRQARLFIEREHNWTTARSKILESIQQSITKN